MVVRSGSVYMERLCPVLGPQSVKVVADYKWYMERMSEPQEMYQLPGVKKRERECPWDCGICECHSGWLQLPVFSVTNDCNLDCRICFTFNRPDLKYYKSLRDTEKIIDHILKQAGEVDLINLTGGEPTLHPDIFNLIKACQKKGIKRITMNTNGLKIAQDHAFAERIKQSGVQLVLSLNTFDAAKSVIIHGKDITQYKRRALEVLEELDIPTTILSVCIKNINEGDVADIVGRYFKKQFVRSITIQNMTFTGLNGSKFYPHEYITIDQVEELLTANKDFSPKDFFPLSTYHPLCYSVAYYLVHDNQIISLSRLIDKNILQKFTEKSYVLNAGPELSGYFRNGIDRLWAEGEHEDVIRTLKNYVEQIYPADRILSPEERRLRAEKMVKMIYIHPHMDALNFDLSRVNRCGDLVPDETGQMIPACSYNLIYRQKDPRFWREVNV